MRFANLDGRLTLVRSAPDEPLDGAPGTDVHTASGGAIPADPALALAAWDEVLEWARAPGGTEPVTVTRERLRAPSPRPAQIFGIGVNYADHGAETAMALPDVPLVFLKLPTAVTGPYGEVTLSGETVDWEVEIAVVIGARAHHVAANDAWDVIAGITVGQDLSDREVQMRPKSAPQFSLGKSLAGFAPLGPVLTTPDELPDRDDIGLSCRLNGEEVQRSTSAQMLFSIPDLIAYLSAIVDLLPGDVIFTGTPSGVGMSRTPSRYLAAGDRLDSSVDGVGTMSHTFRSGAAAAEAGRASHTKENG